ncbi:MAG: cytochrome C oxidase subunit IV family protein [Aggregatilineales bacterium]
MAEEHKDELTNGEVEELANSVPGPDEYPEGQAEDVLAKADPDDATAKATAEALDSTEEATDSPIVEAFDAGVTALEEGIEKAGRAPNSPAEALAHDAHGDVTVWFGREFPFPVYTMVFGLLAVATLIEVILAELIGSDLKIPILLGIAIVKAGLVVWYYMHLNHDSRVFALTLALPLIIALLSALFLMGVDPTSY